MNKIDELGLTIDLFTKDGYCHLNHGSEIKDQKIQAIDYLVVPLGELGENGIHEISSEITIPICQECLDGLNDPEWLLMLCLNCISSQWIYKKKARLEYINKDLDLSYRGIILNGCPKCTKKFNGIWFIL